MKTNTNTTNNNDNENSTDIQNIEDTIQSTISQMKDDLEMSRLDYIHFGKQLIIFMLLGLILFNIIKPSPVLIFIAIILCILIVIPTNIYNNTYTKIIGD